MGLEPLPEPLKLRELSQEARSLLWHEVYQELQRSVGRPRAYSGPKVIAGPWHQILYSWHVRELHLPADEFNATFNAIKVQIKELILVAPYNDVLDFLQFVMRHGSCSYKFHERIDFALRKSRVAYTVGLKPPTIVPRVTEQEGQAITRAFATLQAAGLDGASTHLR